MSEAQVVIRLGLTRLPKSHLRRRKSAWRENMNDQEEPSRTVFSELSDRTQYMDLRELSSYIYDLKLALLCTEALEDIDDKSVEANCQYHNALAHLDLASTAMKLAHIKHKKGE